MNSILLRIRLALLSASPYLEVLNAVEDTTKVKVLLKKFNGQRTISLGIFSALLAIYIRQERAYSASFTLGAILFTCRISFEYDGVSEEAFRVQVAGIGAASYTTIQMLPGLIVQLMLLCEIKTTTHSLAFAFLIAFGCYILRLASLIAYAVSVTSTAG